MAPDDTQLAETRGRALYQRGQTTIFASRRDPRFAYCMYVPPDFDADPARHCLAVVMHGTGRSMTTYRDAFAEFGRYNRCVILAPLFPVGPLRDGNSHGFKYIIEQDIHYDQVLLSMVDDVAESLGTPFDRFLLFGYFVLKVHRENGPDYLTFVEAGGLARSGVNQAGLAIPANYLRCERDYRQIGVPISLIRRKVLEQQHMALAMRVVVVMPKSCSNNMMLSTREGFAIDFECAPDEYFTLYPTDGILVHANHWESDVAKSKIREMGVGTSPDTLYRSWRVNQLLRAKPKLSADDLKNAFFDDFGSPYSVCRPPRPGFQSDLSATVAMIIMDSTAGTMEVAPLPAINHEFTRYSLVLS